MKVETATIADIERLKPLGDEWYKTNKRKKFGIMIEPAEFYAGLEDMINDKDEDVLILTHEGKIVGCLGIYKFKSPLSKDQFATEHYWYVMEEYRTGRGSLQLLGAARQWAKDKGCNHLIMNASKLASNMHDKICKLYEHLGMIKFETAYIQEIL